MSDVKVVGVRAQAQVFGAVHRVLVLNVICIARKCMV
jgi:hypothetical protein